MTFVVPLKHIVAAKKKSQRKNLAHLENNFKQIETEKIFKKKMASIIPANYSFVNFDEDYDDPDSPRLVIDEEIDVVTCDPPETEMTIDNSPKQVQSVLSRNLMKDMNTLNKFMKRQQKEDIHQGASTHAKRSRMEIEAPLFGEEQQKHHLQNTCLPRELDNREPPSTSAKRPRIEIEAPSAGEEQQKNDFTNNCLPRKCEMSNAEQPSSTSDNSSQNQSETPTAEEQQKDDFMRRILGPELELCDVELARRAQLQEREEELFEKFLKKADIEYPLELAYHDRKARKNVSDCDCNESDCNACKRWIRNLKSLESRHKANSEYRLNLLRILYLQERIERVVQIEKMMKAIFYEEFD